MSLLRVSRVLGRPLTYARDIIYLVKGIDNLPNEIIVADINSNPVVYNGTPGATGPPGLPGAPGAAGVGVPAGGLAGQVLAKSSATDHDTAWVDPAATGGAGRTLLTANVTLHCNATTGSDVTGDGSVGAPWATLQHAWERISLLDLGGWTVNVVLDVPGTYGDMSVWTTNAAQKVTPTGSGQITIGRGPTGTRDDYTVGYVDIEDVAQWVTISDITFISAIDVISSNLKLFGTHHVVSAGFGIYVEDSNLTIGGIKLSGVIDTPVMTAWGGSSSVYFYGALDFDVGLTVTPGTLLISASNNASVQWWFDAPTGVWAGKSYDVTANAILQNAAAVPGTTGTTSSGGQVP